MNTDDLRNPAVVALALERLAANKVACEAIARTMAGDPSGTSKCSGPTYWQPGFLDDEYARTVAVILTGFLEESALELLDGQ